MFSTELHLVLAAGYQRPNAFVSRAYEKAYPGRTLPPTPALGLYSAPFIADFISADDIIDTSVLLPAKNTGYSLPETRRRLGQFQRDEAYLHTNPEEVFHGPLVELQGLQLGPEWELRRQGMLTASMVAGPCDLAENPKYDDSVVDAYRKVTGRCEACETKGEYVCWHCEDPEHADGCPEVDARRRISCDVCAEMEKTRQAGDADGLAELFEERDEMDLSESPPKTGVPSDEDPGCPHYCRGGAGNKRYKKWGSMNPRVQFIPNEEIGALWFVQRGLRDEYKIAYLCEKIWRVDHGDFEDGKLGWREGIPGIGASPDGVLRARMGKTGLTMSAEYKYPKTKAYEKPKLAHLLQCMMHMMIHDTPTCCYISYHPTGARVWRVFRSLKLWRWMQKRLHFFYFCWAGIYLAEPEFQNIGTPPAWFEMMRDRYFPGEALPLRPDIPFAERYDRLFGYGGEEYEAFEPPFAPLIGTVSNPEKVVEGAPKPQNSLK